MIHKFLHIWQKIVEFGRRLIRDRLTAAVFSFTKYAAARNCLPLLFTFYLLPFTFYSLFIYERY